MENTAAAGPNAVRAKPIGVERDASLDDALAAIVSACLDQFTANLPAFRATGHPESVHQMRVALRRLRAAIGLTKRALPCPELETASARAKAVGAVLGETRDWDVFHAMLQSGPRESLQGEPSFYALLDAVELRRDAAHKSARKTIDSAQTNVFVVDLREAISRRVWRRDAETNEPGSARRFAERALARLRRNVVKKSEGLASLTADQRHEARIALKKARYAAEFFQSLFETPARKYLSAIARMQDSLGAGTDLEMASQLLDKIDASQDAKTARAVSFARGWCACAQRGDVVNAKAHEKAIHALTPFWA